MSFPNIKSNKALDDDSGFMCELIIGQRLFLNNDQSSSFIDLFSSQVFDGICFPWSTGTRYINKRPALPENTKNAYRWICQW